MSLRGDERLDLGRRSPWRRRPGSRACRGPGRARPGPGGSSRGGPRRRRAGRPRRGRSSPQSWRAMTYISRSTRSASASASASTSSAESPASSSSSSFLANFSLPIRQSPVDRGRTSRSRNARCSSRAATIASARLAQLALALRLAREGEELVLVEPDRPLRLLDRRLDLHARRVADRRAGDLHHLGDLRHPRQRVLEVRRPGQGRLRQQQVDALGQIVAVDARIVLERPEVLGEPDRPDEVVAEDVEVDLRRRARASPDRPAWGVRRASGGPAPGSRPSPRRRGRRAGRRSGGPPVGSPTAARPGRPSR